MPATRRNWRPVAFVFTAILVSIAGVNAAARTFPDPPPAQQQPAFRTKESPAVSRRVSVRTLAEYLRDAQGRSAPKIGLALSGGGARGLAQIGVLKALERYHIPIRCIVGTSIGALIGGLYASGYTADELDSIARTTDWQNMFAPESDNPRRELYYDQKLESDRSLITLQLNGLTPVIPSAAMQGTRLTEFINTLVWNALYHSPRSFDSLKYSFRAVTADLATGERVIFDRGNLAEAIRASATAPLRFTPVSRDSLILVDGGLISNIPADVAKDCGCEIIIVVNTTSPLLPRAELTTPWNVADQVVTLMMRRQYAKELALANFTVTPALGGHGASDFTEIDSLIAAGDSSATRCVAALRDTIARDSRFSSADRRENDPTIARVAVVHAEPFAAAGADSILQTLAGKPYSAETCLPAFERALGWFRKRNLSYATIAGTEFDSTSGALTVTLEEGDVRSIAVSGNTLTDTRVIAREMPFTTGKPFRLDAAQQAAANLNSTELFRQTTLEAAPSAEGVNIRVRVVENSPLVLRLSGKIDNERNTQLGAEIADDNLFGRGVHAGGLVYGGLRNRIVELSLSSRRVLSTYLTYNLTAYNRQRDVYTYKDSQTTANYTDVLQTGEYSQNRTGAALSVGENVPTLGLISFEARYERQQLNSLSGLGLNGAALVASLGGQLRFDTQDRYPFARSGSVAAVSFESAQRILGANTAYTKFSLFYEGYFSYNRVSTFHPRVMFGFEDETTPTIDQFRLGGQESFFGLREDQYLGNQIFAAGLEYRYLLPVKLYFDTYVKIRYDIGTVWPQTSAIHFGDLRHGLGVSVALDTPVGTADFALGRSFILANPIGGRAFAEFEPVFFYFMIGRGL